MQAETERSRSPAAFTPRSFVSGSAKIFTTGAKVQDTSGLLEGDYADGRRLALFCSPEDVCSIITKWLKLLEK
jgi:hypothetical protein